MDQIEDLKKEIVSLKIRIRRIEELFLSQSDPKDYIHESNENDVLFDDAIKILPNHDQISASLLQRRFAIGYSRAARLLDQLEEAGYLDKAEGSRPRKIIKLK